MPKPPSHLSVRGGAALRIASLRRLSAGLVSGHAEWPMCAGCIFMSVIARTCNPTSDLRLPIADYGVCCGSDLGQRVVVMRTSRGSLAGSTIGTAVAAPVRGGPAGDR
jgi:hypothetical protein